MRDRETSLISSIKGENRCQSVVNQEETCDYLCNLAESQNCNRSRLKYKRVGNNWEKYNCSQIVDCECDLGL